LPRKLEENLVDIEQSYRLLKSGDLKGEQKLQEWQLKPSNQFKLFQETF